MRVYGNPGQTLVLPALRGAPAGLGASLTLRFEDRDTGDVVVPESAAAIDERPRAQGTSDYYPTRTLPDDAGIYVLVWRNAAEDPDVEIGEDEVEVTHDALPVVAPVAGATYAQPSALRVEIGLAAGDTGALSDAEAVRLIVNAEDRIDSILPARVRNAATSILVEPAPETGRRIDRARLASWQADKLSRATAKLAAVEQRNPKAFETARYKSVKGPDFEYGEPINPAGGAAAIPTDVAQLLVAAMLLPTSARV